DAITIPKQLNQKVEGGEYIQGLGVIPRMITYIPSDKITQS
ncbi:N-acetylmuramoyl-L-alanine amidase-like domain-containing protein, partial [Vibrio cholerae]